MTDRSDFEDLDLPDDLRALHEELSSIRYEERPSFGPELRAELGRVYAQRGVRRPMAFRRHLAAAALAGLLVVGAAVPSARASLVRWISAINSAPEAEVVVPPPILTAVEPPALEPQQMATPEQAPIEIAVVEEVIDESPLETIAATPPVAPMMMDRDRAETMLQDAYPMYLQREGIGGTVWLRMWIDSTGTTGFPNIAESSGVPDLDRAALRVAPLLTFAPGLQSGRRVGTWIRFPVLFEPDEAEIERVLGPLVDPLRLPDVERSDWWELSEPLDLTALPRWPANDGLASEDLRAAGESLASAFGEEPLGEDLGPVASILAGVAPEGQAPTRWRASVAEALAQAIERAPGNPTPLLALGRIRLRQGLRTDARGLFEQGLQIVVREEVAVSPLVVADLHYERGTLIRDGWLASHDVGRVRGSAFAAAECEPARSSGDAESGFASVERLIAWNYLCPLPFRDVFNDGFELTDEGSAGDLTLMMASFGAAVEAYPAHVGANVDLLVTLATEGRWDDVLAGARRFTRASGGHPDGLLLAGLALQRLDRSEEAAHHFDVAFERMSVPEADELYDISFVIDPSDVPLYRVLSEPERRSFERGFWASRDRTPRTEVNELRVEHLARAAYAHLRFGSAFGDAGEVLIRFGAPNSVHVVGDGSGRLAEFWDYGSGPDITFVRWVTSERTDLTPEGRAYVDDLGKILPPQ